MNLKIDMKLTQKQDVKEVSYLKKKNVVDTKYRQYSSFLPKCLLQ